MVKSAKEINANDIMKYFGKLNETNWKYKQALLDIKEYLWNHKNLETGIYNTSYIRQKDLEEIDDKINKALGSDNNEKENN